MVSRDAFYAYQGMNAFSQLCSSQPHKGPHPADPTGLHPLLLCPALWGALFSSMCQKMDENAGIFYRETFASVHESTLPRSQTLSPTLSHSVPEEHLCHILRVRKLRQKVIASPKVTQLVSMRTRTLTPGFWLQVREPSNKHVLTFIQMPGQFVYPDTQQ